MRETVKRFTLPRDIYHGRGAMEALATLHGERAMICVGGGSMRRFGFLDKAVHLLQSAGMRTELIEGIEPDPSVQTVQRGAEAMRRFQPDWIVAIGGGSPLDAAKAMWILYEHPQLSFEDICRPFSLPPLRRLARLCAISSTSGTASEVTAFSVITDNEQGVKYPLADYEITPDVAIVDPELCESMPPRLVAHTGMDALTHAVEAYVSDAHSDYTDPLAMQAVVMIDRELERSYRGDPLARERMHNAQCLAGMAFTNALLGITHSLAHKTGAAFADLGAHVIHGAANAALLPKVIAYNARVPSARVRYARLADAMQLGGAGEEEKTRRLIRRIRELNSLLRIPSSLRSYGSDGGMAEQGFIPEEVFLARVEGIAARALADACTGSNPRKPTAAELAELLRCGYYDREVDF